MAKIFKNDNEWGLISEKECLPIIQEFYKDLTIEKTKGNYNTFDFTNNSNLLIELKTRTNTIGKYPDTIIGINKIIQAKLLTQSNPFLKVHFWFRFSDCIAYWEFSLDNEKDLISKIAGRNDRGKNEYKEYYAIPVNKLTVLNNVLIY
jgi:hypothetical protein